MVRVVLWVLEVHVLEQSTISSDDVIRTGPDLLYIPPHDPHAPILQLRLTSWEEVQDYVL